MKQCSTTITDNHKCLDSSNDRIRKHTGPESPQNEEEAVIDGEPAEKVMITQQPEMKCCTMLKDERKKKGGVPFHQRLNTSKLGTPERAWLEPKTRTFIERLKLSDDFAA